MPAPVRVAVPLLTLMSKPPKGTLLRVAVVRVAVVRVAVAISRACSLAALALLFYRTSILARSKHSGAVSITGGAAAAVRITAVSMAARTV